MKLGHLMVENFMAVLARAPKVQLGGGYATLTGLAAVDERHVAVSLVVGEKLVKGVVDLATMEFTESKQDS